MAVSNLDPRTVAIHAGIEPDPDTGAVAPDISMAVNNAFAPGDGGFSVNDNPDLTALPFMYARWTNPTVRRLEIRIAALEGTEGDASSISGLATASGMAAAAAVFFSQLKAGDHLMVSDVCYPGVRELAGDILTGLGVAVSAVNLSRLDDVKAALRPNTRLIHGETPCNPLLRLTDLRGLTEIAHAAGALVSIDSTMATPVGTRPLAHGVDFVIHSLTKYINGHGDVLGGMVVGAHDAIEAMRSSVGVRLGASLGAQSAWLILRGADTLYPRMAMAAANAMRVAETLAGHPSVTQVIYPGLASHPQHELAQRQMDNFGGVLTFQTTDPDRHAALMAKHLKLAHYAVSLGHQRSNLVLMKTADLMASTYHLEGAGLKDYRRYAGDGVFRLSVGLEAPADLCADLTSVLDM